MTSNHLDYTSQNCRVAFTEGQKERARLSALNSRANLLENFESVFEVRETTFEYDIIAPLTRCGGKSDVSLYVRNTGTETLTSLDVVYGSSYADSVSFRWVGSLGPNQYKEIALPQADVSGNRIYLQISRYNEISVNEPIISTPSVEGVDEYVLEMTPDVLGG
jgi:hypothetical protein